MRMHDCIWQIWTKRQPTKRMKWNEFSMRFTSFDSCSVCLCFDCVFLFTVCFAQRNYLLCTNNMKTLQTYQSVCLCVNVYLYLIILFIFLLLNNSDLLNINSISQLFYQKTKTQKPNLMLNHNKYIVVVVVNVHVHAK